MQRVILAPADPGPDALAELKDWLGISLDTDDAQLTALLRAALDLAEGFTALMPLEQDCEEVLTASSDWQSLSTHPVQAITQVQGIPAEGARFVLPATDYALDLMADGSGRISIINSGAAGRVAVRFTAGLVADWASLPDSLRQGLLSQAAHLYRSRENGEAASQPPATVVALWRPWRRIRLA